MNFTSNKKKRLSYQRKAVESLSKKRRKISPSNSLPQKNSERFNYFIDILNTNKKDYAPKKSTIRENNENNPDNSNDLSDQLKLLKNNNRTNDLITIKNINDSILEEIEKSTSENNKEIIGKDEGKNITNNEISNDEISKNADSGETVSNDLELKKYFKKSKLLCIRENKIIQRNINLILNKEKKSNKPLKINKKEIDIVNQFQLNALGYINFYTIRRKELLNSQKANINNNNIFKLNEEELERLIDQEWIILDKNTKNQYIETVVKKQTRLAKKKIKTKKANVENQLNDDTPEIILDNENTIENEQENNSSIQQQQSINIPNIPDSEVIENELKEYAEINLLIEMYNRAKQVPIPHFSVIKHPPNPFTIYTKDNINTIIKKNPSMNRTEALKIVAKNWKKASKDERKKYMEKSKDYKDDYEDLIKYAYLQRALIRDPGLAKLCLENQLKEKDKENIEENNIEKEENINFKELDNDEEIIKAFKYIVRKFPKGYPLASPILRFPERGLTKQKKNQSTKSNENNKDNETKKIEKSNNVIKPKVQAFDFFVKDRYELLFKSTPSISLSELLNELEKEWKYLSYEDKLPYILLEIKDIKRYYMDQCELSKERRGKKRRATSILLNSINDQNIQDNENEMNDDQNNIVIVNHHDGPKNHQTSSQNILKPKRILKRRKSRNQHQNNIEYDNENENATLIENSEDEQDYGYNLLYHEKNKQNINNERRNNFAINNNEMEETYIDSDTSEEYLPFDNVSRKFFFENYNENEQINTDNVYDFDIQTRFNDNTENINSSNKDDTFIPVINANTKNDTFIPVIDANANLNQDHSLNYSLSQDTVVYNSQEESNDNTNEQSKTQSNNDNVNDNNNKNNNNNSDNDNNIIIRSSLESNNKSTKGNSESFELDEESKSEFFQSPNTILKNALAHTESSQTSTVIIESTPLNNEHQSQDKNEKSDLHELSLSLEKSSNNNSINLTNSDRTVLETPPVEIESSMKSLSSLNSDHNSLHDSNLETPKNSKSSRSLINPLKPLRKSSIWKFGNDIGIIQQVSEEKINFISNKIKDNDGKKVDNEDEINSSSSSSDSSSEEELEEEGGNIFKSKRIIENQYKSNQIQKKLSNNSKHPSVATSKLSSPIKYSLSKRMREEENEEEDKREEEDEEEDEIEEEDEEERKELEGEGNEVKETKDSSDEQSDNNVKTPISSNKTPINKHLSSTSTPSSNEKAKNKIKSFIFENSFVTPKKNDKFKFNYSSSNKKKKYFSMERRKYDLF